MPFIVKWLEVVGAAEGERVLDFTATKDGCNMETILQDIVRRSQSLTWISLVTGYGCSKMRPDGFGGAVLLMTATSLRGASTHEILAAYLAEEDIDA